MNNDRRKAIQDIIESLHKDTASQSELVTHLTTQKDGIESLRDEEQDYFDNMPEGFQQGARGDAAQEAIEAFETALSELDDAIALAEEEDFDASEVWSKVEDVCSSLEDASM